MTVDSGNMSISGKHVFCFCCSLLYVWLLAATGRQGMGVGPSLLEEKLR